MLMSNVFCCGSSRQVVFVALAITNVHGPGSWAFVVVVFSSCMREGFLVLCALPDIAVVNDLSDALSHALADGDWSIPPTHSLSHTHTYSAYERNVDRVCLWVTVSDKPIRFNLLGTSINSNNMKIQLSTAVVIMAGSFLGYFIEEMVREDT